MRSAVPTLLLLLAAPASAAGADERKAVLVVVQDFFDALKAKDEARVMALVVAEGTIAGHDSRGREAGFFTERWPVWAKRLLEAKPALEERMHGPRVRVRGTMASVWTYYTFWRDGKFSHCGIDNFDMAKVGGRWKILNLTFTMETQGCRKR